MDIQINDDVKVINSSLTGKVISIDKNTAVVLIKDKHVKVSPNKLERLNDEDIARLNSYKVISKYKYSVMNRGYSVSLCSKPEKELMIRHQTSIEAMQNVEKFIDTAFLNRLGEVKIIHGKNGGILRNALHELLATHPNVESYHLGDYFSGQYGVTIVKLKILKWLKVDFVSAFIFFET